MGGTVQKFSVYNGAGYWFGGQEQNTEWESV